MEEQLHTLVDCKKIIITESSVRKDLQLADEEGVDCLPNSTIFKQLTLMGYDWSDQAEESPTNFALMAYSSISSSSSTNYEVTNELNCCSSCLECVKDLKEQNEQLVKDLRTARISVVSYKTGLEYVEARLLVFKKNESVYEEDIKLLKHEIYLIDLDITERKRKLELATKEKDEVQLTVQKFENSSKSLRKLLDSQIMDKCKTGLGYNAIPPPYIGNFMPPKPDLVYPSLDDFVDVNECVSESVVEKPTVETNEPKTVRKENEALIIEDWVSKSEEEDVPKVKTNRPMKNVINNAYSTVRRRFNKITAPNNSNFTKKVNTVKGTRVNTARPKAVLSAVKGKKGNAIKALTCWVWRPKYQVLNHGNPQQDLKDKVVIDSRCSRHMTGNISYLTDYEEIDGGFVAFRGNSKGGKITRIGKIRSGKLDFEDVYFVKELKFNLFSVSQMRDKKNSVLFTNTECVVLSLDFKLTDESHVLLKVPRKDNMYSVDLKNVVPQGAERKNRTLIEAARTMLADSKLPTTLWAEAVNTACYVQNRVLVIKPHNKNPYELFLGSGPNWLFDIDALTKSMNYNPVVARNQFNGNACTKACDDAGKARVETVAGIDYILLPLWTQDPSFSSSPKSSPDAGFKPSREMEQKDTKDPRNESEASGKDSEVPSTEEPIEDQRVNQEKDSNVNNTNNINTVSPTVNAASKEDNVIDENIVYGCADDPNMPDLKEIARFSDAEDDSAKADMTNLDTHIPVSPIPTTRIHKDHPVEQIIGDIHSAPQTRRMAESVIEHAMFIEPNKVIQALKDPIWIEAMQEELLNKKDERGIMVKNKARLVAQGHTQEEGIDYDEKKLCTEFEKMMHNKFQMSSMGELIFFQGLQVKKKEDGIFISQDKYVTKILKKFGFSDVKTTSTPMETHKPLLKDADGEDINEHLYRSMIGSLMYLTSSRPDIMFVDSPFDLVAYTDSDYAGASLDRKSTIGGCQFLRCILISWQYKKQTMVANSTTEAEIRHHSFRDSNKKKLIQMIKIHTDQNVTDLLIKAFDVSRFQYLIASIGMLNL
ncbi:ribonuclease H-like domain-containing protein [Tanacetum coccineum]